MFSHENKPDSVTGPDYRSISDPCLFADDDGRIYLYAFRFRELPGEEYNCCQIVGYELNRDNPRQVIDFSVFGMKR